MGIVAATGGPLIRSILLAAAVVASLLLSGCAPTYDQATQDSLRGYVVSISEASVAGDWQTAIDDLDTMALEVAKAQGAGKLGAERLESITRAMELVRQDLEAAIAAAAEEAERQRVQEAQAQLQQQLQEVESQLQQQLDQVRTQGSSSGGDDDSGGKDPKNDGKDGKGKGKDKAGKGNGKD